MRRILSKAINLFISFIALWAWVYMTFGKSGQFSTEGIENLRYFTVLSNLFQAVVSLAYVFGQKVPRLKYTSTTAVALTFFVVLLLLGPVYGYETSYVGANFWFHLILPVLAMVDFIAVDRCGSYSLRESLYTMIPMLAYSLFYVGNLILNGVKNNDWYGFAVGGPKSAVIVFLLILLGNWIIALLLRLPKRRKKPNHLAVGRTKHSRTSMGDKDMPYSAGVEAARVLATKAHEGQTDKAGLPYITHPERVANRLSTPEAQVVAWLHDTVEDTPISLSEIEAAFSPETAAAVDAISRRVGESWSEYLDRVAANPVARQVKISDLIDNSNLSRIPHVTLKDVERQKKYNNALENLLRED